MKIQAIPTTYAGVNFRSRLEARWAAMFDLLRLEWDYEPPVDFPWWIPDFMISTAHCPVYVEVKPAQSMIPKWYEGFEDYPPHYDGDVGGDLYEKAKAYWQDAWVLCLGLGPTKHSIGALLDTPDGWSNKDEIYWSEIHDAVGGSRCDLHKLWRNAGNMVQWKPRR